MSDRSRFYGHALQDEMRVSPETIYRSLHIQGKGGLKRELVTRPAAAEDLAVPGSWDGDLVLGAGCGSAIATFVERSTRFTLLALLPGTHDATSVREAMAAQMVGLAAHLAHSLTWDQDKEMAEHPPRVETNHSQHQQAISVGSSSR